MYMFALEELLYISLYMCIVTIKEFYSILFYSAHTHINHRLQIHNLSVRAHSKTSLYNSYHPHLLSVILTYSISTSYTIYL